MTDMKAIGIFSLMLVFCIGGFAQSVILDDFEAGVTDWTTAGYPTLAQVAGGANSTAFGLNVTDAGWSMGASKTFTAVVPEAGDYKVTFYYKNGHADSPQAGLQVKVNGGATVDLPATVVSEWTLAETGFVYGLAAGSNIIIDIVGNRSATLTQQCAFDEFTLVKEVPPVEAKVYPLSGYIVSGTPTITVIPEGGTGSYTSVSFDIGNNGSIEYTDSTPGDGFTFEWDTTLLTSGKISAVTFGIVITDSASSTGEENPVYGIDNRYGGRDSFVLNGGVEDWTGQYPAEWVYLDIDSNGAVNAAPAAVIIQETTAPFSGSLALGIRCEANPDPYRYIMATNAFDGMRREYLLQFAGKGGGFCRMYYLQSEDGATWISTWHGLNSNSTAAVWNEVLDAPYTPAGSPRYLSVATHSYGAGTQYWDDVSVTATGLGDVTAVGDFWDLYR